MERVDLDVLEAALAKKNEKPWGWADCVSECVANIPALIAEVRELREEAARARWCEEKKAEVSWSDTSRQWRVSWVAGGVFDIATGPDRNAAIDAARGGK